MTFRYLAVEFLKWSAKFVFAAVLLALLLGCVFFPWFAHGQTGVDNTFSVKGFGGATVGQRTTAAQRSCNPDTSVTCVIVFDPTLAKYPKGTMPTKCAQCIWMDYTGLFGGLPFGKGGDLIGMMTVLNYGAKGDGVADDTAVFTTLLNAGYSIYVPKGTYKLSSAIPLSVTSQHIYCDDGAVLLFTGATHGVSCTSATPFNMTVENCSIRTTNAGALDALHFFPATYGSNIHLKNVKLYNTAPGAWTHGLWTNEIYTSVIDHLQCQGIDTCVHLQTNSNGNTFVGLDVEGTYTTGFELFGSESNTIVGGVIEGAVSGNLLTLDATSGVSVDGTHFEGTLTTTDNISSEGFLKLRDIVMRGHNKNGVVQTGTHPLSLSGVDIGGDSAECSVKVAGNAGATANQSNIILSSILNANATAGKAVCLAAGWNYQLIGNHLQVGNTGPVVTLSYTDYATIQGNQIGGGGYGIDVSDGSANNTILANGFFVPDVAHICNGCVGTRVGLRLSNYLHPDTLDTGGFVSAGTVRSPAIKSTTGNRFVCVDTAGNLVSQAAACSGT